MYGVSVGSAAKRDKPSASDKSEWWNSPLQQEPSKCPAF
jgi:hypothetical protein